MIFIVEERPSESSFVETIWQTQSEDAGTFISPAVSNWEMVVWKQNNKTHLTVRGPETEATSAQCPANAEFFGIQFKLGSFMPNFPVKDLVNRGVTLPDATSKSFWLHGSAWQFPNYENADLFVTRLIREGLLVRDDVVDAALQNHPHEVSARTVRHHFLRATGLTQSYIRQIERAQQAVMLLEQGRSIADTIHEAGYFDQPHLTKSLKRLMGHTPAQIARASLGV